MASLAATQGKYENAESLIRRSLQIRENELGMHHLDVASSLNSLGELLHLQVM